MPKDYSQKNIQKLKNYFEQNGSKTIDIKPNNKANKGYSIKPLPNK